MVKVVFPCPVMDEGLKLHAAWAGKPVQLRVTGLGVKEAIEKAKVAEIPSPPWPPKPRST